MMNILGLALASSMLISSNLSCRGSIEYWSEFLKSSFNETIQATGTSAAGYDYWFYFSSNEETSANTWTVVVHNLLQPGSYCTGPNMFGRLSEVGDHLPGVVL
jgi:hypothetical protein